jgi:hypothetical protein
MPKLDLEVRQARADRVAAVLEAWQEVAAARERLDAALVDCRRSPHGARASDEPTWTELARALELSDVAVRERWERARVRQL